MLNLAGSKLCQIVRHNHKISLRTPVMWVWEKGILRVSFTATISRIYTTGATNKSQYVLGRSLHRGWNACGKITEWDIELQLNHCDCIGQNKYSQVSNCFLPNHFISSKWYKYGTKVLSALHSFKPTPSIHKYFPSIIPIWYCVTAYVLLTLFSQPNLFPQCK